MSQVVIAGDVSGTVTLQAPSTAGTTVLTLPSTSGTLVTTASGTANTATNIAGGSAGEIPFQTASGATSFTGVGTSGQVLTSAGTGTPTWSTPSAGAMSLISTQTASGSSSIAFTGLSGYDKYLLIFTSVYLSNNLSYLNVQFGTGSGPSYITSGCSAADTYIEAAYHGSGYTNSSYIALAGFTFASVYGNPATSISGSSVINNMLQNTNGNTSIVTNYTLVDNGNSAGVGCCNGIAIGNTSVKTAIKIYANNGNITSGIFSLYGISS